MKSSVTDAIKYLKRYINSSPSIGLILGSGLDVDIRVIRAIPYRQIPQFPVPTVMGHQGLLCLGKVNSIELLLMKGRIHIYEGYLAKDVAFPVAVMASMGVKKLIVTNSSGGINRKYAPGDVMFVVDQINLMGDSPLSGPSFVDISGAYEKSLSRDMIRAGRHAGIKVHLGVLAGVRGPAYETPAEVRMLRKLGADAVCMSTIPEVIAAKSYGMRVIGLSFIANRASNFSKKHAHHEVLEMANRSSEKLSLIVKEAVRKFAQHYP